MRRVFGLVGWNCLPSGGLVRGAGSHGLDYSGGSACAVVLGLDSFEIASTIEYTQGMQARISISIWLPRRPVYGSAFVLLFGRAEKLP